MIELNNVTLVAVACIRVKETLKALKYSMSGINFKNVKLLTSAVNSSLSSSSFIDGIECIKIDNLDYIGYNKFMVYDLHKHIDTDFALVIQDDGYVINPPLWREEFLDYDYIGAPWKEPNADDKISFRDLDGIVHRVGNGGFSLRSKKIMELPTDLNIKWESYRNYYNEDGFLCVFKRRFLEENGCKFAPLNVAIHFSHESDIPENQEIIPFGFHGKWSKFKRVI